MNQAPLPVAEARAAIAQCAAPLGPERLSLDNCLGRFAAQDVRAEEEVPPFDNSAMDGFAVRAADLVDATEKAPVALDVVDESRAGRPASVELGPGETVAISTGAAIPAGADAVVPIERTVAIDRQPDASPPPTEGDSPESRLPRSVAIESPTDPGAHLRRAGDDLGIGDIVIESGMRLRPPELGSLASTGVTNLLCARRPKLALLTTGDELVEPGRELGPGQIRDTSRYAITAMAEGDGAVVAMRETVPDQPEATRKALARALEYDITVVCGGVSVGAHDHVKGALESLGVRQVFWRVAMRPGGPTWFGSDGRRLVFGLPGNPVSALVTFHLFVRPAIALCQGGKPLPTTLTATLATDRTTPSGRAEYLRCRLERGPEALTAIPTRPEQSSHLLTSMIGAEGLAVLPADRDHVRAGEPVEVELLWAG